MIERLEEQETDGWLIEREAAVVVFADCEWLHRVDDGLKPRPPLLRRRPVLVRDEVRLGRRGRRSVLEPSPEALPHPLIRSSARPVIPVCPRVLYSDATVIFAVRLRTGQPQVVVAVLVRREVTSNSASGVRTHEEVVDVVEFNRVAVGHHPEDSEAVVNEAGAVAVRVRLVYVDAAVRLIPIEGHVTGCRYANLFYHHLDFPDLREDALVRRLVEPLLISAFTDVIVDCPHICIRSIPVLVGIHEVVAANPELSL